MSGRNRVPFRVASRGAATLAAAATAAVLAFATAALLAFAVPQARAVDPPPMGTEVRLDHGFRYWHNLGDLDRCAVTTADSTVLLAIRVVDRGRIMGWRRHSDGREIDVNGVELNPIGVAAGAFDLSSYDRSGWKLAYLVEGAGFPAGWHGLRVRDLDPATLQPRGSDLVVVESYSGALACPAIAWSGTRHILVWDSGSGIQMVRIRADMTLEDAVPIQIGAGALTRPVAVAADTSGGVILARSSGEVVAQLLDSNGLPVGDLHSLAAISTYPEPSFDVCRFGDGPRWFFAGAADGGSIFYGIVDSTGEIASPGIGSAPHDGTALAVSAANGSGLIGWHSNGGTVGASLVTPGPYDWTEVTRTLSVESLSDQTEPADWRSVDCAWTGDDFVLSWDNRPEQVTKRRDTPDASYSWASAQWISPAGDPRYPEPIIFEQGTEPWNIGVFPSGNGYLAINWDELSAQYIHRHLLDATGTPNAPSSRYASGAFEDCAQGWISCELAYPTCRSYRAVDPYAFVLYGFHYSYNTEIGTWIDWSSVVAQALAADGSIDHDQGFQIEEAPAGRISADATRIDVARAGDAYVIAYSRGHYWSPDDTSEVVAVLEDASGQPIRSQVVSSNLDCYFPSVASIGTRFLMVWLERYEAPLLRKAIIDPAAGGDPIIGEPVADWLGVYGAPYMIPGPDQVLCVFPAREPGGDFDIYRMRFASDGTQLDPAPIPICRAPGDQGNVGGVWDGNNYVVLWSNLGAGAESIVGTRLAPSGFVFDSPPFVVADGVKGPVSLATNAFGQVLAAYDGDRVRSIDDTLPLLDDGEFDDPGGLPTGLRIGAIAPNPGRGSITIRMDMLVDSRAEVHIYDAAGRLVRRMDVSGAYVLGGLTWDGRRDDGTPAPAGMYLLRVSVGDRKEVRRAILIR